MDEGESTIGVVGRACDEYRQVGDIIFFFFFKQKTAYEILTCDWSSDVCSSDLFTLLYGMFF